ncbi:hypothetical protein QU38_02385, partial [Staphylococcus aureus]
MAYGRLSRALPRPGGSRPDRDHPARIPRARHHRRGRRHLPHHPLDAEIPRHRRDPVHPRHFGLDPAGEAQRGLGDLGQFGEIGASAQPLALLLHDLGEGHHRVDELLGHLLVTLLELDDLVEHCRRQADAALGGHRVAEFLGHDATE